MEENVVTATIEIPYRSRNKYEIDKHTGRIRLDRVLYSAMAYPAEYGFLENTLAPDGDPLDILVIGTEPTFPGCEVPARVIGYLTMVDSGHNDNKLISVVNCDPRYDEVQCTDDLPDFIRQEIKDFFENYKNLQHLDVTTGDYHSREEALRLIQECRERWQKKQEEQQ